MIKILFDVLMRKCENSTLKNRKIREEEEKEKEECKAEIRHHKSDDMQHKKENDTMTVVSAEAKCVKYQEQKAKMNEFYAKIKTAQAVTDDMYYFTFDNDEAPDACIKDPPYQFISGDRVKAIRERRGDDGTFPVVDMKPKMRKEVEFGRVTLVCIKNGFAVFEDKIIVIFKHLKEIKFTLKLHEEYKFVAVESEQNIDAKSFDYRVLDIIEKIDSKVSERGIKIISKPFKINLHPDKNEHDYVVKSRHIDVKNISEKSVNLMTVKAVSLDNEGDEIVELDMAKRIINFNLSARNGSFKIYFRIKPLKVGTFRYELTIDFGDFEETHVFSVEISKTYVISGPKMIFPRFIDIRLSEYAVPSELLEIDYTKTHSAVEALNERYPFLAANIDAQNYLDKMRYGIYLEEISLSIAFSNYRLENIAFEAKDEFLKLPVRDLAERRPSIVIGDKILATDPHRKDSERPVYEGVIHKVENESILCKFHSDFHSTHNEKEFNIEFGFSRSTFKRQQHALDVITSEGNLGYDFLFPKMTESKPPQVDAKVDENGGLIVNNYPRIWYNNLLNIYQKNSVVNVLRGQNRPLPYIFFGCPGSGKTQTIIETILQVHTHVMSSRIIVATPSNSAANLITEMLINSKVFEGANSKKFIRLVSNNQVEKDLIPEQIYKYCATVNIAADASRQFYEYERDKTKGILGSVTKNMILDYRIVIATLNCYGSFLQMKIGPIYSHIFIDEAGQSVEPETLIPLTLLNKTDGQCILAGDPNQLGPILTSYYGKIFNYHFSMLERLLLKHPYYQQIYGPQCNEYDSKFVTKLKINYRALPSLLKVYNELFYNNELESAVDEKHSEEALFMSNAESFLWKHTNKKCSVFFVNVNNGRNRKIKDSCSWYNDEEIRAIISFLHKCSTNHISFKDIGIVTPYSLQVKKMKHQIAVGMSDTDLKIGTVEEFQGQERLVIIVSTVRSEEKFASVDKKFGLGFLQCRKRMNVAISRAKALLVVFGKESILKKDENWNHLINYAKENRTYVSDKF